MTDPAGESSSRRRGRPAADPAGGARSRRSGAADGTRATSTPARTAAATAGTARRARPTDGTGTTRTAGGAGAGTSGRARSGAEPEADPARDRPEPVRGPGGHWPMADRSVLPSVLGVPPIAAVGLAAALTAIGVLVDLTRAGNLSTVFTVCHISGCVLAVAWVRRTGLFGPMVQPPLLVALAVPAVVLLAGSPRPGQGVAERLLVIGAPLVNAFPVMAWSTGVVLVLGLLRVLLQRPVVGPRRPGAGG